MWNPARLPRIETLVDITVRSCIHDAVITRIDRIHVDRDVAEFDLVDPGHTGIMAFQPPGIDDHGIRVVEEEGAVKRVTGMVVGRSLGLVLELPGFPAITRSKEPTHVRAHQNDVGISRADGRREHVPTTPDPDVFPADIVYSSSCEGDDQGYCGDAGCEDDD